MILLRWPGTCAPRDRPGKRKSEGCVPKRRRIWPNRMQPPDESHLWDPILQAKLFSTKHKLFENDTLAQCAVETVEDDYSQDEFALGSDFKFSQSANV